MRLPRCRVLAYTGTALQGGGHSRIVRPLPPTQRTLNTIRPTSQDFAPPTALAKAQAHQVYSTAISTLSKLCGTPKSDDNDPKITPRSAMVCPRLNPIAARFTHSQPGVPTGVRVLSILLCMTVLLDS